MKKQIRSCCIIIIWIVLWQIAAEAIHNRIIFVGPLETLEALVYQCALADFWKTIFSSFLRISLGFLSAFFLGILLGAAAARFRLVREFLEPFISLLQSVPVASFVILALIWIGSGRLSILVTFLVVFPVIYRNVLKGISQTDPKMMEMARVYHLKFRKRLVYLYRPAVMPYLQAGCSVALGMAWKSGIAAEVIGVPAHSIGEKLYMAKIYFSTAELFAWTFVIILVSKLFEKLFLYLLGFAACDLNASGRKKARKDFVTQYAKWTETKPDLTESCAIRFGTENSGDPEKITVSHLRKSYGEHGIYDDLSLSLEPGRIYCLLGSSGSGKTTLLRILMGLEGFDQGTITGLEQKQISTVFQEDRLFDFLSPLKNIRMVCGSSVSDHDIRMLLEQFLDAEAVERPVSELSGGMKRRVAVARALAAPSDLILMDEPFTGLDDDTRNRVIHLIQTYLGGRTLLLVTHQEEDVRKLGGSAVRITGA